MISEPCFPIIAVYPRWRGEHVRIEIWFAEQGGLSPLARGTQLLKALEIGKYRFIPAGAGNTKNNTLNYSA